MPFCAPQIVFSSVRMSQTGTFTDTFIAAVKGLYRVTINLDVHVSASNPSLDFGGSVTEVYGQSVNFAVSSGASASIGQSSATSYDFSLAAGATVALSPSSLVGSPTFDTQFVVEQLA